MEFVLLLGKPKATKAMKAGSARHAKLEEEVYLLFIALFSSFPLSFRDPKERLYLLMQVQVSGGSLWKLTICSSGVFMLAVFHTPSFYFLVSLFFIYPSHSIFIQS